MTCFRLYWNRFSRLEDQKISVSHLQVSVHDAVLMQVGHGLQDLSDHTAGVFFCVNTSIQNTVKQLSTRNPSQTRKQINTHAGSSLSVYFRHYETRTAPWPGNSVFLFRRNLPIPPHCHALSWNRERETSESRRWSLVLVTSVCGGCVSRTSSAPWSRSQGSSGAAVFSSHTSGRRNSPSFSLSPGRPQKMSPCRNTVIRVWTFELNRRLDCWRQWVSLRSALIYRHKAVCVPPSCSHLVYLESTSPTNNCPRTRITVRYITDPVPPLMAHYPQCL